MIANPPFSLKAWGDEQWASDRWGRNIAGTPPKGYGDWAWVQHMIASMAPKTGRLAVVLPHGALFRQGAEGKIRSKVLDMDLIEAVIGLGPNLFYGTGLAACIVVVRRRKAPDRQGKVLLIDGADLFKKGRNQNTLEPEHVKRTPRRLRSLRRPSTVAPGSSPSTRSLSNDDNLNLAGYVAPVERRGDPHRRGSHRSTQRRARRRLGSGGPARTSSSPKEGIA